MLNNRYVRTCIAVLAACGLSAIVLFIAAMIGFGSDVDFFSTGQIFVTALVFLSLPTAAAAVVSVRYVRAYSWILLLLLVICPPLGFTAGRIPMPATGPQLTAVSLPSLIIAGIFLFFARRRRKGTAS